MDIPKEGWLSSSGADMSISCDDDPDMGTCSNPHGVGYALSELLGVLGDGRGAPERGRCGAVAQLIHPRLFSASLR